MKLLKKILMISFVFGAFVFVANAQLDYNYLNEINTPNFNDYKEAYNLKLQENEGVKEPGWKQYKRWEYFWEQRVGQSGEFPNMNLIKDLYITAVKEDISLKNSNSTQSNQWTNLGPNKDTDIYGHGRVNVIRFNPKNTKELWAGSAGGGVWKSSNGGATWTHLFRSDILSLGVSDIAVSTTDPKIVYVGTGDSDGAYTAGHSFYSVGILKTTDGGSTWEIMGDNYELADRNIIGRILVDPKNHNIVVVGTNKGIIKTIDGGNTWTTTHSVGRFTDMEYIPDDFNHIYASTYNTMGGATIFYSTNAGDSWTKLQEYNGVVRIALAVTPANTNKVFALLSDAPTRGFYSFVTITIDGDEREFETMSSKQTVGNILSWGLSYSGGQGFYDLALAVNPFDEKEIYVGGIMTYRSTNGGKSWGQNTSQGGGGKPYVHADVHDLVFTPDGTHIYNANDGGLDFTSNKGTSWSGISKGLEITQFYRFANSQRSPAIIVAGAQDNGTSRMIFGDWTNVYGGDGMESGIDPTDDNRVYASSQNGNLARSVNGGNRFYAMLNSNKTQEYGAWVTPYAIAPSKTNVLYAGYQNVWRSTEYGTNNTWQKISNFGSTATLRSIAVAPTDHNTVYAATYTALYVTYDGGVNWDKILSSNSSITYVAVHPDNPEIIYVTKSGYSNGNKVYMYDGSDWLNISGNLPNVPSNTIVYQKDSPNRLYVGTDIGVYYTDFNSGYWEKYNNGLPNIIVTELEIQYSTRKLRAVTYGRGAWEVDLIECNEDELVVNILGDTEFCEGESVTLESAIDLPKYLWSTGETTKSIDVSESGTYALIYPKDADCKPKSVAIDVNVLQTNDLTIYSPDGHVICEGDTIALSASFGFETDSYLWSNGETGRKIYIHEAGDYSVSAVSRDGCEVESEVYLTEVKPKPDKPIISKYETELQASEGESYQWFLNEKRINGADEQVFTPEESGDYTVEVFNEWGCSSISDPTSFAVSVHYELQVGENIAVTPNPTIGSFELSLNLNSNANASISISDMMGNELISVQDIMINGNYSQKFDINAFSAGMYFIKIYIGNAVHVEKIIKQ